ncbi:hypothetical protein A2U01_0117760, partial [Trifolium medium]|nr:hypothetical protein [Trifolium medium]
GQFVGESGGVRTPQQVVSELLV